MSSKTKRPPQAAAAGVRPSLLRQRVRVIAIAVMIFVLAGVVLYAAIGPQGAARKTANVEPPAIPAFDLSEVEPRVGRVISAARDAVAAEPRSADRWGHLGQVCDIHGFLAEAAVCYEFAMQSSPRDVRWPYLLGFVYDQSDQPASRSVAMYDRALALRPEYWPALVRRGDASAKEHDFASAQADFMRARAFAPDEPALLRRLGQAQLELGQPQEAIATLLRASQLNPNDQSTHAALSKAYSATGDVGRADEASRKSAATKPSARLPDPIREEVVALGVSSTIAMVRADNAMSAGAFEQARADLQIALEARSNDVAVHARLGRACAALGKRDEAIHHLSRAIELDPTHAASYVRLGSLMSDMGKNAQAVEHLTKAVELEPDNGASQALLAIALARAGRAREALPYFERSAALIQPSDTVEHQWGVALMQAGEINAAVAHIERSIMLKPNQPDVLLSYGMALELAGREEDARQAFTQAVRINPNHRAAEHLMRLTKR